MGVKVSVVFLDVVDCEVVYIWVEGVVVDMGQVNLIFNNVGVVLSEIVENMGYENFEWLMNINFWGVVYGIKVFLFYLKIVGEGYIINIFSVFGMIGVLI